MLEDVGSNYYNRGLELLKDNRISEGMEGFRKALEFGGSSSSCYNLLGLCLFSLGRFNESLHFWEKSIKIDNTFDNPAHSYIIYIKSKSFESISKDYNVALKYGEVGKYKKAVEILKNHNVLRINCVLFHNFYGLCLYAAGDRMSSQKAWIRSLRIDSSNVDTLYYLSMVETKETKGILEWIGSKLGFKEK